MAKLRFNGVLFPIGTPRITMPFRAFETKWYSPEKPHRGVDIAPFAGSYGEPVRMPLHGDVVYVGEHQFAGNEVVTRHAAPFTFGATALNGDVYTIQRGEVFYLRSTHHAQIAVAKGEVADAGDVIARIGSTGAHTTGPHVHLELHKGGYPGIHLDPIDFFIAAIPGLRDVIVRPW